MPDCEKPVYIKTIEKLISRRAIVSLEEVYSTIALHISTRILHPRIDLFSMSIVCSI